MVGGQDRVAGSSGRGCGDQGDARTTIAGRYEVVLDPPLGAAGLAFVYRGKDLRAGRDVAVKTLRPQYRDDPEARARFRREARLLAFLAHPNAVRVFDLVEDHGTSWVVLEWVSGRSLKELLAERGSFGPDDVATVLDQAAAALGHLHARGVVHLDVKPQNLLLTEDGRLKLTDFGSAQPAGRPQDPIGGRTVGTGGCLAPEQLFGQAVTAATDVYHLGCLVHELLTGRLPFASDRPAYSMLLPPLWAGQVVLQALAENPALRYPGAEVFARVFRDSLAIENGENVDVVRYNINMIEVDNELSGFDIGKDQGNAQHSLSPGRLSAEVGHDGPLPALPTEGVVWIPPADGGAARGDAGGALPEEMVESLAAKGVDFGTIPEGISPGMPYTTPGALKKKGITSYSHQHVARLVRDGTVTGYHVGEQIVLPPEGVRQLLERERASQAGELRAGGRRPGPKGPRTAEARSTDSDDLFTVAEAAEHLGVTPPSVIGLIHRQRLPAKREGAGRGRWLIDAEAVRTFRRAKPGPQPTKP